MPLVLLLLLQVVVLLLLQLVMMQGTIGIEGRHSRRRHEAIGAKVRQKVAADTVAAAGERGSAARRGECSRVRLGRG